MPDHTEVPASTDLSTEIGSSLATVWARYAGARPAKADTQLEGSVVRWAIADGTAQFERAMEGEPAADGEPPRPRRTINGYKRETAAAVARTTHCRVVAMLSRHDAKTGVATETFILEASPKRY